jgi:CRP-like cAMP-binding protein
VVTLEASKLFCELNPGELTQLRSIAREQSFGDGQEIFKEGDQGDGVYVVKEGLVEISGLVGPKARHVFSRVAPGDIFGEMAVLDQKTRSACAVARGNAVVYFIPRADMLRLVERSPGLALALLREISQRLREFNRQYVAEVLQTERLAILGRFARSIIHDLKNPLNIISITAEMAGMERASTPRTGDPGVAGPAARRRTVASAATGDTAVARSSTRSRHTAVARTSPDPGHATGGPTARRSRHPVRAGSARRTRTR